ncbi:dTDP-4-dehydrorhamnose reductase [Pseudomonas sp.]|uniref:dTDP-4-dehydrorhamnose reductase n=1 Tax=Pseudomonas sp. TaxID=306 RepID=UPI002C72BD14|nr:dTDP-4-dehydrorhamnose reductase [Pseudomonas sp.]HUE91171.1 dTDP-4-dehydrorhamnose reductase [Pseudomonas sp.]
MRVLITGAHGQVGHELMRLVPEGFEAIGMGSAELNIADAAQVAAVVARVQPQLIINAAAYTAVDKAESESQLAYAVNRDGVAHLASAAQARAIALLHLSTDYVFAGDATAPYGEQDATAPTGVYGASKLAGELALVAGCSRYMILRTSWVFGAHGNNFVKTMLRLGRERDELSVVADQQGCPTSAASIARALWTLAQQYRDSGALQWGLYHYSGMPACSWHGFAQEIFAQGHELGILPRVPVVHGISTAQYPTPAKRPAWSVMDCSRLQQAQQITPVDWRTELRAVLLELAGQ